MDQEILLFVDLLSDFVSLCWMKEKHLLSSFMKWKYENTWRKQMQFLIKETDAIFSLCWAVFPN